MSRWRAVALGFAALAGVATLAGALWFQATILSGLPDDLSHLHDTQQLPTACEIVDAEGNLLDTFYVERRYPVYLDTLPPHVWQAFVASEDATFFEHGGVDPLGILRAVVANLRAGHTVQGGSTLTQQVVKNVLLTSERSLERKLKEAVLAQRLERELGKEAILELYLELVYLGGGNYGIEAAARDYFGVGAHELDAGQAALLAGLVPAPSRYTPRVSEDTARERRRLVLRRMAEEGYLSPEAAAVHTQAGLGLRTTPDTVQDLADAAYLTAVRRDIREHFGAGAGTEGLRVTVPLDPTLQQAATEAAAEARAAHLLRQGPRALVDRAADTDPDDPTTPCFPARVDLREGVLRTTTQQWPLGRALRQVPVHDERIGRPSSLGSQLRGGELVRVCLDDEGALSIDTQPWAQSAVVVVEHATGHVVALADGGSTQLEGFVRALQARRQPGSSFKPYVYATSFAHGRSLLDTMSDAPLSLPGAGGRPWSPKNYSGGYAGTLTLRQALAASTNTIPVRLTLEVGASEVARVAQAMGVHTALRHDPTLALGASEVTPLDQATGYATLARGGRFLPSTFLASVQADGRDRTPERPSVQVVSPGVAWEVVEGLRAVVTQGTGRVADVPDRFVAGKTGTTNDNIDAWFVGLTDRYTVAVWVGTDRSLSLGERETGGRAAGPAFRTVVEAMPPDRGERVVPPEVVRLPMGSAVVGLNRATVPQRLLPTRSQDGPLRPLR